MPDTAYKAGYDKIDWSGHKPWVPAAPAPNTARSGLASPMCILDTMEATQHVDGNHYTSKAAFRAVTKREGFIEVGNDPARLRGVQKQTSTKQERRNSISKAIQQTIGA